MAAQTDSGYAYVILFASFVGHILQYGVVWTVGVFFAIFVEVFPDNSGTVALISSLNTAFYYGAGPLSSFLTNKYGPRLVSMGGGLVGSAGLVLSMYANNVYTLYVTFGVIAGFGLGLAYIPVVTIVGQYFEKYRSVALGVAVSGCGIGTFIFPPVIRFFIYHYGWRGALLLIGAITLNMCVVGSLLRPFPDDSEEKVTKIKADKEHPNNNTKADEVTSSLLSIHEKSCQDLNHLKSVESKLNSYDPDTVSINSLKNNNLLNLFIFQNFSYLLLCLNNFFVCFGLSIVYVHLAAYASTTGIDADKSALLFSVIGIANFIGRIAFGFLGHIPRMNHTGLYTVAFFLSGIVTAACPLYKSYPWFFACSSMFGFLTGAFGTLLPQCVIQILEVQYLTSGYGYLLIFEAVGTLLGAPVAGWLYVWSDVYDNSLYLGGVVLVISALIMVYPWLCGGKKQNNHCCKNQEQNSNELTISVEIKN